MDIQETLANAVKGDADAMESLISMQREGKAIRLYPFGRKGPLDEGVCPVIVRPTQDHLIRFQLGRSETLILERSSIAGFTMHIVRLSMKMLDHYGYRYEDMESLATPGLGCHTFVTDDDRIALDLQPPGLLDYDLGLYHARKLISYWLTIIQQQGWDYKDCGFTDETHRLAFMFSMYRVEF